MGKLTTRLGALAAVAAASFALAVACGGPPPFTPQPDDAGDQGDATTSDGGGDGPTTTTPEGSAYDAPAFDAPPGDDTGVTIDSGCGETPVTSQGSFVSTTTLNPGGPGHDCTPQSPCPTIQDGIAWAKLNARKYVYVEKGTYTEQVKLADGITVRGGWERDGQGLWQIICDGVAQGDSVHIVAPATANITVLADGLAQPAGLHTVRVFSRAAGPGESLYGLFVRGASTNVALTNVSINMQPSGNGAPGATGASGTAAPLSCTTPGGPAAGAGTAGAGGKVGTFTINGYTPGDGQPGGFGTQGPNGAILTPHQCTDAGSCMACLWHRDPDVPPPNNFVCDNPDPNYSACGSEATIGCGSAGGDGGAPGHGGGSNVGLFVWGGSVTLDNSVVTSASGGGGGAAGPGGVGGTVTNAIQGAAAFCASAADNACGGTGAMGCKAGGGSTLTGAGGTASNGIAGGQGGPGGGGAGGSSYGYYVGNGGMVTVAANSSVKAKGVQAPGGPSPGGNAGANGDFLDHNN